MRQTDALQLQWSILIHGTQFWSLWVNEEDLLVFLTLRNVYPPGTMFIIPPALPNTAKSEGGHTFSCIQSCVLL